MLGNWFKTTLLMAAIVALFGVVGAALGGAGRLGRSLVRRRNQEDEDIPLPIDGGRLVQLNECPCAVHGFTVDVEPPAYAAHGGGHFFRNGAVCHGIDVQQKIASLGNAFHQFFMDLPIFL